MERPNIKLNSVCAVIETLGGISTVSKLTGSKYTAVQNWKTAGFPAKTYLKIRRALERTGHHAPDTLWNML
jgi:hypothetical protein